MKIVQITDLHVGRQDEIPHGVDVRSNFLDLLEDLSQHSFDALVISGDLCLDHGDSNIYQWIKQQLARFDVPIYFLSGNHDDTALLVEHFGLHALTKDSELYYSLQWEGHPVLFLDSSSGCLSERQLHWLEQQLSQSHEHTLVFIHHPTMAMGVPYMDDNHALRNAQQVTNIFENSGQPVTVFCGHYHVDKACRRRNVSVHVTPSCYFQIDWHAEAFSVDHLQIGYRWIELSHAGLQHSVRYLAVAESKD